MEFTEKILDAVAGKRAEHSQRIKGTSQQQTMTLTQN
jgi:hypothetical protein